MPTALSRLIARVRASVRARDLDRDFEQELASHLAMLTEDNLRRGLSPEEARRAARIRLGGAAALTEQHREARGICAIETARQDLRFAVRLIARGRGFSCAAIAALALGIGANTIGFTMVRGVFLRALPFEASDRLYIMSWQNRSGRRSGVSEAELEEWRARSRTFESLAAYRDDTMNLSDDRSLPEEVSGTWLTANAFTVLRQRPLLGRGFAAGDDRPGAEPVAIIGYGLWKGRYGGDPSVVGRTFRINGSPATIVGVMPEGMRFPDRSDLWVPLVAAPGAEERRGVRGLRVFGRTTTRADRRAAQAELSAIGQQLIAAYPDASRDLIGVRVETFTERFIGGIGRPMFLNMMGAGILVLLIACANVANLLLSRSPYRAREIAVRMAIGATRWRVVRQLLLEAVVLALVGGAMGLLLASVGVSLIAAAMENSGLPYWVAFRIEPGVFGYVAGLSCLTAVVFGLAPALHVSKARTCDVLKEGGRGATSSRRTRLFSSAIVMSQLALTTVLLAASLLMLRSFVTLYRVDLGVSLDLLTTELQLPAAKYPRAEARRAFYERLEQRIAAIPGVEAAAVTTGVPSRDGGERLLEVDRPSNPEQRPVFVSTVAISPRFFDVVRVPVVRGRNLTDRDGTPGAETVIVNEALAAQFFPGEDPIGRRLRFVARAPVPGRPADPWRTIVGTSGRILHGSSVDRYENAVVYLPLWPEAPSAASVLIRGLVPAESLIEPVRRAVQAIDADQPVLAIRTLEQVLAQDRWWFRTWGAILGTAALVALVLASLGVYAVMAYAVTERTQEIGVRMAVGAARGQVCWLILRRGLQQLAIGLVFGLAGAVALNRILRGGLADLSPADPAALLAVALIVTAVAMAACLLPALRASRVDPVVALRAD